MTGEKTFYEAVNNEIRAFCSRKFIRTCCVSQWHKNLGIQEFRDWGIKNKDFTANP